MINQEFAAVVNNFFNDYQKFVDGKLQRKIDELELTIEDLEDMTSDYHEIRESLDYLDGELYKLEKYIDENADGTDYMRGMQDAYDMIER